MRPTEQYIIQMCQDNVISYAQVAYFSNQKWKKEWITKEGLWGNEQEMPYFDIASLTKVLGTTKVILQLLKEKKLTLNDKVSRYLPIANQNLEIIHLLTHTSDFIGYIPNRDQLGSRELERALYKEMVPGPLLGKEVRYSDTNFIYLGKIIEEIYQKSVQEVILEQVIEPLSLKKTTFHPEKSRCIPTDWLSDTLRRYGEVHDPKARILKEHCGSAGLFSTLDDLCQLVESYLTLPANSFEQNLLQKIWTQGKKGRTRSLGWVVEEDAQTITLSHTGYTGMYLCWNLTHQKGFIFLSQRLDAGDDNERYLSARDSLIQRYIEEEQL